ncbi:MAG TPA: ADOP family duplicated permease, partial [Acidobacteriaceae bacterium]
MQTIVADIRYAHRALRRAPAFVLTVVATLAIGIGLNTAIFTVVDCVLLRPLGYHDADRIVALQTRFDDERRSIPRLGGDDYTDLARQVTGLEATAHYHSFADGIELGGSSLYVPVAIVSPRFAQVMGVEPVAGRLFHPGDAGGNDVLVSASFAADHFASVGDAVGKAITYSGAVYTVAGVLPRGFSFPEKTELWFESRATTKAGSRTAYNDRAIGKRRAGVSAAQLDAELAAFSRQLQRSYAEDRNKSIEAVALQEQLVGPVRSTLKLLMGAVAVLLLIVCANVTHLELARATRQLRAVTIRAALGATRARLTGIAVVETALLAGAGSAAAVLLAMAALRLLLRMAPPDLPRLAEVHLNLHVLVFSTLVSLLVMTLAALVPVWRSWQVDPAHALRQDAARGTESRRSLGLRNSLLVAEVALTLTLSVCAILLARQLLAQSRQDLGFSPDSLITLDTHAILSTRRPVGSDSSAASRAALEAAWARIEQGNLNRLDAALASVAAVPGVDAVAGIGGAPMGFGGSDVAYAVKGRQVFAPGVSLPDADLRPVTPGLFATMGIPLLRGRGLSANDLYYAPHVALINQELARKTFGGQDPVGQQFMCGYDEDVPTWITIVGVVGDIRSDSPATAPKPTLYVPVNQHPGASPDMQFVVRTRGNPAAMAETLRRALGRTHPEIAVKATTMRENIGETERGDAFRTLLLSGFAGVSVVLAALGTYGVTSYTVSQRSFEFALRMAVGATRAQVLGLVLGNTLRVVLAGIGLGLALSVALSRVFSRLLGELPAFDPAAYAGAAVSVVALGLFAAWLP